MLDMSSMREWSSYTKASFNNHLSTGKHMYLMIEGLRLGCHLTSMYCTFNIQTAVSYQISPD